MSKWSEQINQMLKEIKQGNQDKKKELYELTYPYLHSLILRYLYDKRDADDAIMDAYYKIYKYVGNTDENRDGYNWLCKIVEHMAYNYNDKQKRYSLVDEFDESYAEEQEDIADSVIKKEDLRRAMLKLTEEERKMIRLRFWEDKTLLQIAEQYGISIPAIKKRLDVAFGKLAKYLGDEAPGSEK